MGVHHVPGPGTLVARGRTVLYTGAPLPAAAIDRVWALLADDERDRSAEVLTALGPDTPPDLVLLHRGTPARVTARGALPVADEHEDGRLVGLTVGGPAPHGLPLEVGVVAAGGFAWVASAVPETVPPPALGSIPVPPPVPSVLIDGIPDFAPSPPRAPAAEPPSRTVVREAPAARRTEPVAGGIPVVSCPAGHLNPVGADTCRECALAVPPQEPHSVPRLSPGRLVLPDGTALELDRGAVLGRLPMPTPGSVEPHLVNVSSHGHHLSRMHLEVVVDGWFVLARDLGSRGGSFLAVPGRPREQLRAHELVTVPPGSVLSLAGDYHLRYEAGS